MPKLEIAEQLWVGPLLISIDKERYRNYSSYFISGGLGLACPVRVWLKEKATEEVGI